MNKASKVMMTALMLTLTTMMSAQELGTGNNTTGSKSHDHRASVGVSIAHDRHEGRHQGRPARHGRHGRTGCEPERYLVTDFDVYYGGKHHFFPPQPDPRDTVKFVAFKDKLNEYK